MESEVDALDTPIGKEILECLLLKTGKELVELLETYSLRDFIDERYELYVNTLTDIYTGDDYHNGNISRSGAEEIARADAFRDL
ncbi:MAG: hypothetical protein JSS93_12875 [Bacteroidetes bacterium]|nr:hypothetical protein [Bacteroidota bacterium]